jgi:hypothetical protein
VNGVLSVVEQTEQLAPIRWTLMAVVGLVSVVTMPITAVWFLMLAPLSLVAAAVGAALARSSRQSGAVRSIGASVAAGLIIGPALYLTLAVVA